MTKKFLKSFVLTFIGVGGSLSLFNYVVDPLQYYRKAVYAPIYITEHRHQIPALARTQEYDSVIIGSSYTLGFRPSQIQETLGFRTLKLSMSAASPYEQLLVLKIALKTNKVKNVIWCLDVFTFSYFSSGDQLRSDLIAP